MRRRVAFLLALLLAGALGILAGRLLAPAPETPPIPPAEPPAPGTAEVALSGTLPVECAGHGGAIDLVGTFEVTGSLPVALTAETPLAPPLKPPVKPPEKPPEIEEDEEEQHPPPKRVDEIEPPRGFRRVTQKQGTFARFVQTLPLKSGREIMTWTGKPLPKRSFDVLAVVDLPLLFKQDLEQCADFAMRLWAEWHRRTGRLDRLALVDYPGRPRPFKGTAKEYPAFLRSVFSGANSHSLKQGLKRVEPKDLRPGDLIVQNDTGGIGHVSVILDMCEDGAGRRLYLIGFSFMPAQELHLERARAPRGRRGWFTLAGFYDYLAHHFPFGKPVLRRFE